jgi:hypothetical protein
VQSRLVASLTCTFGNDVRIANPDHSSFDVDAYEYVDGDAVLVAGGNVAGVVSTGFAFTDSAGQQLCGPLTAILAVDTTRPAAASFN